VAETATHAWTIGALLNWTERYFAEKAVETPRLDAQVLLAHVLGCGRPHLYTRYEEQPPAAARGDFRDLVRRRVEGTPVAYLVGHKEFYLLPFEVTPDVLIPRPATESLVMATLDRIKGRPARVLELCCGSGCVGIAVAKNAPEAAVLATELSPAAVAVAGRNVVRHGLAGRVTVVRGDLFDAVPAGSTFDAIVGNPPYVPTGDLAALSADVRDHEPRLALDGGPDGFAVIDRIFARAAEFLAPAGWLLLEVGAGQAVAAAHRVDRVRGLRWVETIADRDAVARVVVARQESGRSD
jgi:release factor glutamine methyltransferase